MAEPEPTQSLHRHHPSNRGGNHWKHFSLPAVKQQRFIAGEQVTPGSPWRIRVTDQLRGRFVEQAPEGWLPMLEATMALGVSRQTVLQRVKRGELRAVHVRTGRRKGLRIEVAKADGGLFDALRNSKGGV